jgi:transposase
MTILWEEDRESYQDGYGYSRFCDRLRGFERHRTPVMRQHDVAGEKTFVEYTGKRSALPIRRRGRATRPRYSWACLALEPHRRGGEVDATIG